MSDDLLSPGITLECDQLGRTDRRQVLTAFAEGLYIEPIFGPDRPFVAASIVAHVRSIMPTEGDVILYSFGYGDGRRIRAYKNGRAYLSAAYWGYDGVAELPPLDTGNPPNTY